MKPDISLIPEPDRLKRPPMSKARRARIFAQHGGICGISGAKIGPGDAWDVEHRIPWAISFDDSDENLYPALVGPHREKTRRDMGTIAKAKAQAGETGQWARRQKRGYGLINSRGFDKPKEKTKWPKRPMR